MLSDLKWFYAKATLKDWLGLIVGTIAFASGLFLIAYRVYYGWLLVLIAIGIPLWLYRPWRH